MDSIDIKGIKASTALTELIVYVQQHPNQPIPMDKIRPAIEAQADYTIAIATHLAAHYLASNLDDQDAEINNHPEPNPPTKTP